ncbi:ppGpp synthetase/RelA/SpoT-type nucleotidyltransferase [Peribacillus cavernae]|nr:ppGpp synthetase/RelA/SpoT-type nucleotidyltransferase [Peribacillus cavernae]
MVEVQIRTIAMDFWASLEHKIYYKYNKEVPEHLIAELKEAATTAATLDRKMEQLHKEITVYKQEDAHKNDEFLSKINDDKYSIPKFFFRNVPSKQ